MGDIAQEAMAYQAFEEQDDNRSSPGSPQAHDTQNVSLVEEFSAQTMEAATLGVGVVASSHYHASRLRDVTYGSKRPQTPGAPAGQPAGRSHPASSGAPANSGHPQPASDSSSNHAAQHHSAEAAHHDHGRPRQGDQHSSLEHMAVTHHTELNQSGQRSQRTSAASGAKLPSRQASLTSQRSAGSHTSHVSYAADVKPFDGRHGTHGAWHRDGGSDDEDEDAADSDIGSERADEVGALGGEDGQQGPRLISRHSFRQKNVRKTASFRLPTRFSVGGSLSGPGAKSQRISVMGGSSKNDLFAGVPEEDINEEGEGAQPRKQMRFRDSVIAMMMMPRRHVSTRQLTIPEGNEDDDGESVMSASTMFNDADLEESPQRRFYARASFWKAAIPVVASILALTVALTLQLRPEFHFKTKVRIPARGRQPERIVYTDEMFRFIVRWFYYGACLAPVNFVAWYLMHVLVVLVEKARLFSSQRVLFFVIGTRVAVTKLLRAGFMLAAFAALFAQNWTQHKIRVVHVSMLRLLGCLTLFMTGILVKTLFAKMLSSRFHKAAHFQKLQDALRKEYLLTKLAQPRQRERPEAGEGGVGGVTGPQKSFASFMVRPAGAIKSFLQPSGHSITNLRKGLRFGKQSDGQTPGSFSDPSGMGQIPAEGIDRNVLSTGGAVQVSAFANQFQPPRTLLQRQQQRQLRDGFPQPANPTMEAVTVQADATVQLTTMGPTQNADQQLPSSFSDSSLPPLQWQPPQSRPWSRPQVQDDVLRQDAEAAAAAAAEMAASARRASAEAAHAANPPNNAALPPHVMTTFGSLESASSLNPLLDHAEGSSADPQISLPQSNQGRERYMPSRFQPDSQPNNEQPSDSSPQPRPQVVRNLSAVGSLKSRHSAQRSSHSQMRAVSEAGSARSRPLSQAQLKDVQREVFAALRPPPSGDELQLLAKMHLVEKHIRNNALRLNLVDRLGNADKAPSSEISSEVEAKKLAFYLYHNVKPLGVTRHHLLLEDLEAFLPGDTAKEAFDMLNSGNRDRISQHELRDAVWEVVQNRANLAATLKDTRTVVGKLERFMSVVIQFLFLFLYLLVWNVNLRLAWIQFSSCVVAGAFVFANSIRTIYESVVFLFVVHPFDVGDGIFIGTGTDYYVVDEICLLNTSLVRGDGSKFLYPNIVMASVGVVNIARSGPHAEFFLVVVDGSTPQSIFNVLEERMQELTADRPEDFTGIFSVRCTECPAPMKMTINVRWENSFNGMDRGRVFLLKSEIMRMVISTLDEEGVSYSLPASKKTRPGTDILASRAGHHHNVGRDANAVALDNQTNPAFIPGLLEIEKQL